MFLRYLSLDQYKSMNVILEEDANTNQGALWLGDYTAANDFNLLKNKNIKTVLTVASGLNITYSARSGITHKVQRGQCAKYNNYFQTISILDIDSANIKRIFPETFPFIQEGLQRGSVLVHCAAGVSRSASTVIAFLMKKNSWSFSEAYNFVKKRRSVIQPNFGFQRQLKQYDRELQQYNKLPQTDIQITKKSLEPQINTLSKIYTPQKQLEKPIEKPFEKQTRQSNIFSGQKQVQSQMSPISRYAPRRKLTNDTQVKSQMLGNKIFINHNLIQKTFQK